MDELELAVEYPLGTRFRFQRTDRNAVSSGIVNGPPIAAGDDAYVPVYVDQDDTIIFVNTKNIITTAEEVLRIYEEEDDASA